MTKHWEDMTPREFLLEVQRANPSHLGIRLVPNPWDELRELLGLDFKATPQEIIEVVGELPDGGY